MSASPLAGPLVVDLSHLLPGPLTVRLLADPGARVIKVGNPFGGERPRSLPRVPGHGEHTRAILEELGRQGYEQAYGVGRRFSWKRLVARWWPF